MFRTERLRAGDTLSAATEAIRIALDVPARILPMSDEAVSTRLVTTDGRTLEFQQYFVAERQKPEIAEIRFAGIADAKPAPGVLEAIESADRVILCPSNPVVSIGPILALPEVRDALKVHPSVTAVSPIVRGAPLKGPADKLMKTIGADVSASGVAVLYQDFVDLFVVDSTDAAEIDRVEAVGIAAAGFDTIMTDHDASERLARALL
jgi:LPPG:FO 2-phospho-L-lactate transferase